MKQILKSSLLMQKRLFKKASFIIILLIIPLATLSVNEISKQQTGMLTVSVYAPKESDSAVKSALSSIESEHDLLRYVKYESKKEAVDSVKYGKSDVAWIFPSDLKSRIKDFVDGKKNAKKTVTVIEREESAFEKLSKEILFGSLYPSLSKQIYFDFVYNEFELNGYKLSKFEAESIYNTRSFEDNLIEFENLEGKPTERTNYLLSPLRGIMAIFITVSSFAAVMYYFKDCADGVFATLPRKNRLALLLSSSFWGALDCGIVSLISLAFTPLFVGLKSEIIAMLVLILSVSAFTAFFSVLAGDYAKIGIITVFSALIIFIGSPVFFSFNIPFLNYILPHTYYLFGIALPNYLLYGLALFTVYLALAVGIFYLRKRKI